MYFEDYEIGKVYEIKEARIPNDEMIEFARKYDPRDFHLDESSAKNTRFKEIIASGFFTLSFAWSKWVKTGLDANGMIAGVGLDDLRWKNPVYGGDIIKSRLKVLKKEKSQGKKQGLVTLSYKTTNEEGKEVLYFKAKVLVKAKK